MANWTSGILTNRGRDLQLKVEAGEKLKMTRFKLGDGMETTEEAADLNDLMGAKIAFGITGIERLGTLCKFTGVVTSTSVSAGFRAREWGLFAEDPDLGEILYMIALDDRPDYIAAQDAVLNSTITYALNVDISQASKIEPVIDPQGIVTTEILEKAAGLVKRNTGYSLNDKAFDIQLSAHPSWRLVCTKAGTTSGVLLNLHGAKLGDTYTDGTAEWTVKDAYEAAVDAHNKASDAHADIRRILDDKAPIESPALTGTPTAPTAGKGTNNGQIASTAFVAQAIAALVNSAPGALDTLQELAAALGNDANFAATVTNTLAGKLGKTEKAASAGNSDTLGGQSLQWIIDQINAAKTGIVAGNLAQNGWVKFANGLIVQWGCVYGEQVTTPDQSISITLPVSISMELFSCGNVNVAGGNTDYNWKNKHAIVSTIYNQGTKKLNVSSTFFGKTYITQWLLIGV